jgi:hypothetical protein
MGTYSLLQAIAVAMLAFLGVIVTLWPPENFRLKVAIALVFGILALLTLKFQQLKENEDKVRADQATLENSKSQAELLNWQRGDPKTPPRISCAQAVMPDGGLTIHFSMENPSEFPAYDISARLWDIDNLPKGTTGLEELIRSSIVVVNIPSLSPQTVQILRSLEIPATTRSKKFGAQFTTRVGGFSENIAVEKRNGAWLFAIQMRRFDASNELIFKEVDKGFPLNAAGEVDW